MPLQQPTPPLDHHSGIAENNARKRVCKACDRCRLKKSKCDGSNPCNRCKSDNAICVFGERKKSHDKVYPKGYVEMLERQQHQLVAGLQELYRRTLNGQGWIGPPLRDSTNGHPLTHEILKRLGALGQGSEDGTGGFEEDLLLMQQRLIDNGAECLMRRGSMSSDSAQSHSTIGDVLSQQSSFFTDPFARQQPPPTPPTQGRFAPGPRPQSLPTSTECPSPSTGLNPAQLQRSTWTTESPLGFDDNMDFIRRFEPPPNVRPPAMRFNQALVETTMASPYLTDWNEDDEFKAFLNPTIG